LKDDLNKIIAQRLINSKRLVILGIGSELMQDDAAGILVTEYLRNKLGEGNLNFKIYTCYTTPENFTKNITDFNPDHIILIDSADLKLEPGSITNLPVERITDFSLGTHKLSLIMMIKYLKDVINSEFTVIAIQYKSIEFNGRITKEVSSAISELSKYLVSFIKNYR
jgi:hydrogenase 3 maturation protease